MRGILMAEAGVLLRAAVIAAAFYAVWGFATGGGTTWAGFAWITLALFVVANALFYGLRYLDSSLVDTAAVIEESANDSFRREDS